MDTQSDEVHTAESGADSETEQKDVQGIAIPAYMNSTIRRQFLQEMVKCLPENVQNRITALKNIQLEHLLLEAEFFEEVYQLERKYQAKYQPLFEKRRDIVVGAVEPPKAEPKWKEEEEILDEKAKESLAKVMVEFKKTPTNVKGVPNFWYTIFRNTEILSEMVQTHDEPVLKKLQDIQIKYDGVHSYTIEFHFDENEYFTDRVLTKQYFLKTEIDPDYPFNFEGPEIHKCKGCVINWEKKMNLTVKTIRKKQKHKERGAVRTVVKQVPNDSFFNFFNPPEVIEGKEEEDEDTQAILATDFEIGHFLRSRIIPKAVLYFTGDIIDDDEEDDDEYGGEEEDDDDDEDDDDGGDGGNKKASKKPNDCPNQ